MLSTFLAGFLGVFAGVSITCFLFRLAYIKEAKIAHETTDKLIKLMTGEAKQTKTGSVLSMVKNENGDKNKPVN